MKKTITCEIYNNDSLITNNLNIIIKNAIKIASKSIYNFHNELGNNLNKIKGSDVLSDEEIIKINKNTRLNKSLLQKIYTFYNDNKEYKKNNYTFVNKNNFLDVSRSVLSEDEYNSYIYDTLNEINSANSFNNTKFNGISIKNERCTYLFKGFEKYIPIIVEPTIIKKYDENISISNAEFDNSIDFSYKVYIGFDQLTSLIIDSFYENHEKYNLDKDLLLNDAKAIEEYITSYFYSSLNTETIVDFIKACIVSCDTYVRHKFGSFLNELHKKYIAYTEDQKITDIFEKVISIGKILSSRNDEFDAISNVINNDILYPDYNSKTTTRYDIIIKSILDNLKNKCDLILDFDTLHCNIFKNIKDIEIEKNENDLLSNDNPKNIFNTDSKEYQYFLDITVNIFNIFFKEYMTFINYTVHTFDLENENNKQTVDIKTKYYIPSCNLFYFKNVNKETYVIDSYYKDLFNNIMKNNIVCEKNDKIYHEYKHYINEICSSFIGYSLLLFDMQNSFLRLLEYKNEINKREPNRSKILSKTYLKIEKTLYDYLKKYSFLMNNIKIYNIFTNVVNDNYLYERKVFIGLKKLINFIGKNYNTCDFDILQNSYFIIFLNNIIKCDSKKNEKLIENFSFYKYIIESDFYYKNVNILILNYEKIDVFTIKKYEKNIFDDTISRLSEMFGIDLTDERINNYIIEENFK